jgi:hypothetical protein
MPEIFFQRYQGELTALTNEDKLLDILFLEFATNNTFPTRRLP